MKIFINSDLAPMKQRVITNSIILLFMTVFLIPRVANLHAMNHLFEDDDLISCEVCDVISISNQFDLITGDNFYFESGLKTSPSSFIVLTQYNIPLEKIASPISFYNKPPPIL